jgi:lysophospholipid acyltransferase (LPLAT)-like uncharacterized protein
MLEKWKRQFYLFRSFCIAKVIGATIGVLLWTCRIRIIGLEAFKECVKRHKCILILWHNRIVIGPSLFVKYTPDIGYAALVSASRDGEILSQVIHSCKNATTIRVPHLDRYKTLHDIIAHVKENKSILIMTPDGPRGPCYVVKQGIAIAAKETGAHLVVFDWEGSSFWQLRSWDRLRIPKPFSNITVSLRVCEPLEGAMSIEGAKACVQQYLQEEKVIV